MLISLAEYAKRHGLAHVTVRQKAQRGNLNAIKVGRNWVIEENEPYIDMREKLKKSSKFIERNK